MSSIAFTGPSQDLDEASFAALSLFGSIYVSFAHYNSDIFSNISQKKNLKLCHVALRVWLNRPFKVLPQILDWF